MDSNHDKQIQSLLCYRYTIRQTNATQPRFFNAGVKPRGWAHDEFRDVGVAQVSSRQAGHVWSRWNYRVGICGLCEIFRACGLEIRDTADWKSALRLRDWRASILSRARD